MEMRKILTWFCTLLIVAPATYAQSVKPLTGLSDERDLTYAFIHASIVADPSTVLNDATLIIRKNKILQVGTGISIPVDAIVIDLSGRYLYPSFIEPFSDYGMPEVSATSKERRGRGSQMESNTPGAFHWNQAIHPETEACRLFETQPKKAGEFRNLGFGMAVSAGKDGIARGTSVLVFLGDEEASSMIIRERAASVLSFSKGTSTQDYPSSLMGSIALLRQTFLDGQWYAKARDKETNISLESWNRNLSLPQVFEVNDYRSAIRAGRLGKEFGFNFIIKGGGDEYKRIDEVKNAASAFIVPLDFPRAYDLSDPYDALNVSLKELKEWELAPWNPGLLEKAGVPLMLTTEGLKDKKDFVPALMKAVRCGLSREAALRALTTTPATMFNVSDRIGRIAPGMDACFFICTGDYFEKDNVLLEHWIAGRRHVIKAVDSVDVRGRYTLSPDSLKDWTLVASGDRFNPEWTLQRDTVKMKADVQKTASQWTFRLQPGRKSGAFRLNAVYEPAKNGFFGRGQSPSGNWIDWSAVRASTAPEKRDTLKKDSLPDPPSVWRPLMAYGWNGNNPMPAPGIVLFKGVTVWTCEKDGILKESDVLIRDGRIIKVGRISESEYKALPGLEVVEGKGLHLTPGLIDEHSHIAINEGVNEGTQTITAEVRIGDVVNPDDINIYRQLAGGVTTSQLLHGSANPIGGQSAIIKLRWGRSAEEMKFAGAPGFIKFALGENVKQSNWGDNNVTRYPQTRMGVEQVYIDAFTRAREYDAALKNQKTSRSAGTVLRRDLELEALAEILNGQRFITCHSYQQGEINMLMHVADSFGFRVNTFTHILEGYKVADKMKRHGVGGSSFADWWAYKYEVIEAIPYNGAVLHKCGVVTAFNSDDAEMARRLNQEAAKAVKYGNVSEEEALKFVTLNPAKLLHIDDKVGSILPGKDADLVLWSGHPLSVYSKPMRTYVDGVCYFDSARDERLRQANDEERLRISGKMFEDRNAGGATRKPVTTLHEEYHCNDLEKLPHSSHE